ncbi:MAG: branched-chain amino acid ABC transporter permease [Candidatus Deferrimicrobiota bacterium]
MFLDKGKGAAFAFLYGAVLAALAALPFFADLFYQTFVTEVLVWVLFAVSFDLIFGYTGLLSFGQALFFGVGAYAVAISVLKLGLGTGAGLLLSVAAPVVFAAFVGYFSVKLSGIHFVIITIIFALIASTVAETWTGITGGTDGLVFMPPPLNLGFLKVDLMDIRSTYYLVLGVVSLSCLLLRRMVRSPLGKAFVAIRENEDRARLIGYDVPRLKLVSFVVAGGLAGLAGGLYALSLKYASATFLHWSISGHAVVYTIVGGAGTLLGPMLGAGLIMSLEHHLVNLLQATDLVVGSVLVFMLLMAPRGLVGLLQGRRK